ncbi:MAG: OmpH family outer membrane protein [Azospirillaceae bacterium]
MPLRDRPARLRPTGARPAAFTAGLSVLLLALAAASAPARAQSGDGSGDGDAAGQGVPDRSLGPRIEGAGDAAAPTADEILVVDFQGVLRDSAAAREIQSQVSGLRSAYQEEFGAIEEELRRMETELLEQRDALDAEAFEARRREFEQRISEAQRAAQARRSTLDRGLDEAMGEVRSTLLDIVADIARDRRARLVITKAQVVLADRALDISAEARSRLDRALPTVDVDLPDPEAAGEGAGGAGFGTPDSGGTDAPR